MSETRKIAAILCSDVVGYSQPAGADEERILARLKTPRSDVIDPTISVHEAWLHGGMTTGRFCQAEVRLRHPWRGLRTLRGLPCGNQLRDWRSLPPRLSSLAQRRLMTLGETAIQSRHG